MNLDGLNIKFSTTELETEITSKKKHYKLIFLIISSTSSLYYEKMKQCWERYMNYDCEQVKCYFLENDINLQSDLFVTENTIYSKYEENYIPGILLKSIRGMNFCNKYYNFDYMVRTNLSSVYYIPRLLNFLNHCSIKEFMGGEVDITNSYIPYISGAGIVMSYDMIIEILNAVNVYGLSEHRLYLPDDVALSHILIYSSRDIPIQKIKMHICDGIITEEQINNLLDNTEICHFRSRNDINRDIDIENMTKLINAFYTDAT
jgi:hypothetical protein